MYVPQEVALDPAKHKMPDAFEKMIDKMISEKSVHENDFLYFSGYPSDTTVFIDVGSNIGNSAVSITNMCGAVRIFGFEPNKMLVPYLTRVQAYNENYRFRQVGLSEKGGAFDLLVPIVDDLIVAGESSTSLEHFADPVVSQRLRSYSRDREFQLSRIRCDIERLDAQADLFAAAEGAQRRVIKIDTEGTELGVLLGGLAFISKFRPTIMIENGERPEIASLLSQLSYSQYVFDATAGRLFDKFRRASLNTFYVFRGLS